MKKIFTGLALAGMFLLTSAQTINFDKTTWEYGTIKKGADGHRTFTIKNTGDKPLILSNVKASCGCTVPVWDKNPIAPGKSSIIKVGYDTNRPGKFRKSIEVFSNDPKQSRSVIYITGNVIGANNTTNATKNKPASPIESAVSKVNYYQTRVERLKTSIQNSEKQLKIAEKNLRLAEKNLRLAEKNLSAMR